ncbi:MAG: gliding motility-associated C-terminal domain-containing protein, partial [Bacteroidales bacterium]
QDSASITVSAIPGSISGTKELNILYPINCSSDTLTVFLKEQAPLTTTSTPDTTLCSGAASIYASGQDGAPPYTYNWSTGDSTSTITINPAASTTYTVTTSDLCNQSIVDTINVKVSSPVITPMHDSVCPGDTAQLSATVPGAQNYLWETGDTTSAISVSPSTTTGFTVTITDSIGCTDTDTVFAFINPLPDIIVPPDTTICEGGTATINVQGAQSYLWNTGQTGPSLSVSPTTNTTYTVAGTSALGCTDSASVIVYVNTFPVADITANKDTLCRGEPVELTASQGDKYQWNTGASGQSILVSPDKTTHYTVTVSNVLNGTACPDDASMLMEVIRCNTYFTPNAFSPNNDGKNEEFGPLGQFKNVTDYEFMIFDRWGNLQFYTNDYNEHWDGTAMNSNTPAPTGTYVYKIRITEGKFEPIELQGTVILIR